MTETISLILGAILPPFIDFLTKKVSDSKIRFGISLVVCILVGVIINYKSFTAENILASIALVFTSAQIIYKTYWKESAFRAEENKGQN
jgi:hypothetical protein